MSNFFNATQPFIIISLGWRSIKEGQKPTPLISFSQAFRKQSSQDAQGAPRQETTARGLGAYWAHPGGDTSTLRPAPSLYVRIPEFCLSQGQGYLPFPWHLLIFFSICMCGEGLYTWKFILHPLILLSPFSFYLPSSEVDFSTLPFKSVLITGSYFSLPLSF